MTLAAPDAPDPAPAIVRPLAAPQQGAAPDRPRVRWLLLAAVVVLPLLVMASGAWLAWREAWRVAASDLLHTADAAAEFGLRTLAAHAIAAGRVDALTRGLTDAEIAAREAELHAELKALIAEVPQAEASYVIDRRGVPMLASNLYPVPRAAPTALDREFFIALQAPDPPAVHLSPVYVSRFDGELFFAVSRRRSRTGNPDVMPGGFDGVINLSVYPNRLAGRLQQMLYRDADALSLVRDDGEILARNTGHVDPARIPPGSRFASFAAEAVPRALYNSVSHFDGDPVLVALRRVDGWPVYAAATRPHAAIIAAWRDAVAAQLAIGVPPTFALIGIALLLLRAQRRLAASNVSLEERVAARTRALTESEARLRLATAGARVGIWEVDLVTGLRRWSPEALELLGVAAAIQGIEEWVAVVHAEDRARVTELWRASIAGAARYEVEFRAIPAAEDGGPRWLLTRGAVERDAAGRAMRAAGVLLDVTARRRAEERLVLLAREVDHRAKNALAVVQAAVRLAPRDDAAAFARTVEGRVAALARAQVLLAEAGWQGAELRDVAEGALAAFISAGGAAAPRVRLDGPPLRLSAAATQPLSLALHELATNAAKYGALSVASGQVVFAWTLDEAAGQLLLMWEERGGPPVAAPARRGFGSRVLDATLREQLGGSLDRRWTVTGLVCAMTVPLCRVVAPGPRDLPGKISAEGPLAGPAQGPSEDTGAGPVNGQAAA